MSNEKKSATERYFEADKKLSAQYERYDNARKQFRVGLLPEAEFLKIQADYNAAMAEFDEAERAEIDRKILAMLLESDGEIQEE